MKIRSFTQFVLAAALGGCALAPQTAGGGGRSQAKLMVASELPSTEGSAVIAPAKNGNTSVSVAAKHLPKPEKLSPPAQVYVVWIRRAKDAPAQNVGALEVDDGLNGSISTLTPLRTFELFVTAEDDRQAQQPDGEPLLWTTYTR